MPTSRRVRPLAVSATVLAAVALLAPAPVHAARRPTRTIVFNGEDNRLNAYDAITGKKQTVIRSAADDPRRGKDINAQICFFPDGSRGPASESERRRSRAERETSRRFIAGEDTAQGTGAGTPGWGIFRLRGDRVGNLSAAQVGKLTTTFQTSDVESERSSPAESNPENYGCGFLRDGRVVTSDVGNQYPGTPNNGQLIVWFPPFDSYKVRHCKIDVGIPTAGGIFVDRRDRVYVTANRPSSPNPLDRPAGVYRYRGRFPTSDTPAGGCESRDPTGAPMTKRVTPEMFIPGSTPPPLPGVLTPSAIVPTPSGSFYVSSVFDGRIAEYTADGDFKRMILSPPPGLPPYESGTPYGIGLDRRGTLYYADLGVIATPPGPGDHNGTVRRIRFVGGQPQPPEIIDRGLAFPDGIGILDL